MNLVISTISFNQPKFNIFFYDYIDSLRNIYSGDVLLLIYGTIPNGIIDYLKENKIGFSNLELKSNFINNQRIYDIYSLLSHDITSQYTKILVTDIDVWFQTKIEPIFDIMNNQFIYTSDIPDFEQIKELAYKNIYRHLIDEKESLDTFNFLIETFGYIINCGVFGARKDVFLNKLETYIQYSKKTNDVYGLDTIILNNIYDNDIIVKDTYNYLTKQNPILKDGKYYTHDNKLISIMHNAGWDNDENKKYGYLREI